MRNGHAVAHLLMWSRAGAVWPRSAHPWAQSGHTPPVAGLEAPLPSDKAPFWSPRAHRRAEIGTASPTSDPHLIICCPLVG